jgi:hypothetical protein
VNACHVFYADGRPERGVKNLGWLVRHASRATSIGIYANGLNGNEATLLVTGDGWVFYAPFASRSILLDWIKRPSLYGVPVVEISNQSITLRELRQGVTQ